MLKRLILKKIQKNIKIIFYIIIICKIFLKTYIKKKKKFVYNLNQKIHKKHNKLL